MNGSGKPGRNKHHDRIDIDIVDMFDVKKSFSQALLLLVISCLAAVTVHAVRLSELPWIGDWSPSVVARIYLRGLNDITGEKVRSLRDEGILVFLDPRDPLVYREDSLPGSLNLPPGEAPSMLPEIRVLADAGMEIVLLCDGVRCNRGAELAGILRRNGFYSFKVFRGEALEGPGEGSMFPREVQ